MISIKSYMVKIISVPTYFKPGIGTMGTVAIIIKKNSIDAKLLPDVSSVFHVMMAIIFPYIRYALIMDTALETNMIKQFACDACIWSASGK